MKKYGGKWWDEFLNYCLFGPAAMFMLVLATNFFAAISGSNQSDGVGNIASATSIDKELISSMVLFFVPITMLWFTMGVSKQFSVAGADIATKYGKDFAKWAGKKAASPVTTRYQATKKGVQKGLQKGNLGGWNYGKTNIVIPGFIPGVGGKKFNVGKYATGQHWDDSTAATEARWTGAISGGKKGVQSEMEKLHNKKVAEEEKSLEENRTSETDLRATMNNINADKAKREAAIRVLSKKDALRTGADMTAALAAIDASNAGNADAAAEKKRELIKKAGGEIYQTGDELAAAIAVLGDDVKGVSALVDKASSKALSLTPDQYNDTINKIPAVARDAIKSKIDGKLKKEGKVKVLIDAEIDANRKAGLAVPHREIYRKYLKDMTAAEVGKLKDLHGDGTQPMDPQLIAYIQARKSSGEWSIPELQEAYSKLGAEQKKNWRRAGLM